jgi:hypothetical protein
MECSLGNGFCTDLCDDKMISLIPRRFDHDCYGILLETNRYKTES